MTDKILLNHGGGGAATARLVKEVFLHHLGGPAVLEDAALLEAGEKIAFTTDSFVVKPLFFPGGDIGKLSVSGTVNDLAVMGADPCYLAAGFVLEEGLSIPTLEQIVVSMAGTAKAAGVRVVAGDTKVVGRGEADGLFINTSGVGILPPGRNLSSGNCRPGDLVLVSGPVGDHGTAVMVSREGFGIKGELNSDCQPLAHLAGALLQSAPGTRCMRDPTRGGLATALAEIAQASQVGIVLYEECIPIRSPVRAVCDLLGLDPLYMACEGRFVAVVPASQTEAALSALRRSEAGKNAVQIGRVTDDLSGLVLETAIGGRRPLLVLEDMQLPRIC